MSVCRAAGVGVGIQGRGGGCRAALCVCIQGACVYRVAGVGVYRLCVSVQGSTCVGMCKGMFVQVCVT